MKRVFCSMLLTTAIVSNSVSMAFAKDAAEPGIDSTTSDNTESENTDDSKSTGENTAKEDTSEEDKTGEAASKTDDSTQSEDKPAAEEEDKTSSEEALEVTNVYVIKSDSEPVRRIKKDDEEASEEDEETEEEVSEEDSESEEDLDEESMEEAIQESENSNGEINDSEEKESSEKKENKNKSSEGEDEESNDWDDFDDYDGSKSDRTKKESYTIYKEVYAKGWKNSNSEENKEYAFNFLVNEMGLTNAAACGILSNIYHESSFNNMVIGDHGTSFGLCQWHGSRFTRLKNFCKNKGYDFRTVEGQMHFLKYELDNTYTSVKDYVYNAGNKKEDAYKVAAYWCENYEIPADRVKKGKVRGDYARDTYWSEYKNRFTFYQIDYVIDEGDNDQDNPIAYSNLTDSIKLKPASRDGYVFEGWYIDSELEDQITEISGELKDDLTVYAKWSEENWKEKSTEDSEEELEDESEEASEETSDQFVKLQDQQFEVFANDDLEDLQDELEWLN